PDERDQQEYLDKWQEEQEANRIPDDQPAVFLEVSVADASEFEADLEIRGEERFGWTEGSPLIHFLRFILGGSGEVAPVTREILRRAEPDRSRRPHVHAG
ncbi:MAG TPA: amino acid transporter, partial [Streptosporangiaceae bacterium]|nr:amino acid transporter [Streptosporangiaceae bacterium]